MGVGGRYSDCVIFSFYLNRIKCSKGPWKMVKKGINPGGAQSSECSGQSGHT